MQIAGVGPVRATGSFKAVSPEFDGAAAKHPKLGNPPRLSSDVAFYTQSRIPRFYTQTRIVGGPPMVEAIARNEKQIGAILRRARRKAGLTQEALGDRVHLRQGTISHLEAGKPAVQLRTLMATLSSLNLELVVRPRSKGSAADIEDLF